MQNEVQLIVGESKFLVNASAQSSGIGGCLAIRVFQDISAYLGNELIYTDAIYGTVKQPYTVFTPWNGTFMILQLTGSCITYTFSAMGTVSIYNNTQSYLDLFENESISQNWKFQDLNNFTAQGAFSREFRVPFSTTNQNALGPLFDVNISAGSENFFHYKLPAEIRVDTLPISVGYVRVRKVYKQSNRISEVELAFYAETPDLVRNIGEKKLKDIVDLPSHNQNMTYDNIVTNNLPGIWTLLEHGQLWSANGEANTRPLDDNTNPLYASDFTPALRWSYLFEQIFIDAGFELVAGTLLNAMATYYMPWLNSKRPVASDSFNDLFFQAETTTPMTVSVINPYYVLEADNEIFDNSGDYNAATYTYTTPADGYYTFQAVLQLSPSLAGNTEINIQVGLIVDGVVIPGLGNATILQNFPNSSERIFTFRIGIDAASTVQFVIFNTLIGIQMFDVMGSWSLIGVELKFGQTFFFDLNAPDMKQIDFVTDVIKMHNCAIVPDRTIPNKISVVPQTSYLGSGNVVDWTSKLDTTKDIVISSTVDIQKGKFQFTYTAGEDFISKQYKNVNRVYGDYEVAGYTVNPNTLPSDFAIGDQRIQLVTQSTPCGVVNGTNVVMPMFLNEKAEFVVPGPRCLYYAGSTYIQFYDDSTSTVVLEDIRLLNHYSNIFPDISNFDLNWAPEVPPYSIPTNPYNNLFNQWWRPYMNALYSPDGRIMEANFALDLKDILTFQFSDKVWIQDSFWRILEVTDYKVGDYESTKVKLLKFLDDIEDCTSTPSTISVGGEVNFVDANGDPVPASQDCCTRYGYNWDEETAICWAFTPDGTRPSTAVGGTNTSPAPRVTKTAQQTRSITSSVVNGTNLSIELGNANMLAVGRDLELTKNVNGSNLLGKNVTTNLPGIHLGGGYRLGNPANTEKGWSQSGVVHFHNKDAFASAGTKRALFIEGIPNEHLEIPDLTTWSCMLNVTIQEDTQTDIDIALLSFGLTKVGGVAYATPVTVISSDTFGTGFTYDIDIDVTTNTAQHRLVLTINGAPSFPVTIIATATLYYQQNKLA